MIWYYCCLLCTITISKVYSQSCEDEILRISNAGNIKTSSDSVEVGQSVIITCSTDCAYYWHTILVDGEVFTTSNAENGFQLSVTNAILNCPDCTEPDEVDCINSQQQQGPVQSILNFTLLDYGDHYLQCIAHLFHPDSNLWPSNKIISIPSKMVKIKGIKEATSTVTEIASTTTTTSSADQMKTSTSSNTCIITTTASHYTTTSTGKKATTSISNAFVSTDAHSMATKSTDNAVMSTLMTSSSLSSSVQDIRLTTETWSVPTSQLLPTVTSDVIAVDTGNNVDQQVSSTCDDQFTMNDMAVYAILGALSIICLVLIIVIVVLIMVNKKTAAQYNQLSLSLPASSSGCNNHYHLNCSDVKMADSVATTPRPSLTIAEH